MTTTTTPSTVADFLVLPLRMPTAPAYRTTPTHYLYLRPNAPRVPTDDTPRELFLVNVPVDATSTHLKTLFATQQLGGARVERVEFEGVRVGRGIKAPTIARTAADGKKSKKRKRGGVEEDGEDNNAPEVGLLPEIWDRDVHPSGSTAVVTFVDRASAELALREARRASKRGAAAPIAWEAGERSKDEIPPLGSARYASRHRLRYPDPAALQASVDAFMAAFAAQERERSALLARQRSVPDADGFVTVTRGGRMAPAREAAARAKEEEFKRREKSRVKDDFYRFQVREKQKEQAQGLVKGFEEDRKKVEHMRRRREKVRPE